MSVDKETARLKKDYFKTMIQVTEPEVIEELRGWKPPNKAYVLFKRRVYDVKKEEVGWCLSTLDVDSRPEQLPKIRYLIFNKGFRIIHWDNFPRADSNNPQHRTKIDLYSEGKGINQWAILDAELQKLVKFKTDAEFTDFESELKVKEHEIARLTAMVEESKIKKVKDESKQNTANN